MSYSTESYKAAGTNIRLSYFSGYAFPAESVATFRAALAELGIAADITPEDLAKQVASVDATGAGALFAAILQDGTQYMFPDERSELFRRLLK